MSSPRKRIVRNFLLPQSELQHLLDCRNKLMKLTREKQEEEEEKEKELEKTGSETTTRSSQCQHSGIVAIEKQAIFPVLPHDQVHEESLINPPSFSSRSTTSRYEPILSQMAFKCKAKAVSILKALENVANFDYHPQSGEIIISGVRIPRSNLTDLLNMCVKIVPPFIKPKSIDVDTIPGLQEFVGIMASTIIGADVFQNPPIKNMIVDLRRTTSKKAIDGTEKVITVNNNPVSWIEID